MIKVVCDKCGEEEEMGFPNIYKCLKENQIIWRDEAKEMGKVEET